MKIAYTCIYSYPSISGTWNRVYFLAKHLIKKGHEVYVFSSNSIAATKQKSSKYYNLEKINIYRFKDNLKFGYASFWSFNKGFFKTLKKINPDIIDCQTYRHPDSTIIPFVAKKLKLKAKIFLTTHAPFLESGLRSKNLEIIAKLYDKIIGKKVLNSFYKIIAISKWEIPFLEKIGALREKIKVIPNGIPDEFFLYKQRRKLKRKIILFYGRVSKIKNLETLLRAFSLFLNKYDKKRMTILKIVGPLEKDYALELMELINRLKIKENVIFLGPVFKIKEKIKTIDDCDIFVLPSKREGMPQTLIEAMARKKIVISSETRGAKEIISDGENGFLFSIGDHRELAEKINFCFNLKENEKRRLEENAFNFAEKMKWSLISSEVEKLYLS